MLVVKLNSSGTLEWAKAIGEWLEEGYSIIQTADGGYAVAGKSAKFDSAGHKPFYVVKLSTTGALQWTRTIGLRDYDIANSIIQTADRGYAVVGYTSYIESPRDWLIVKLDTAGSLEWTRVVGGGTEVEGDEAFSIIRTIDGGYAVTGVKDLLNPSGDMFIVKYDSGWNTCGSNDSLVSGYPGTLGAIISVTPTITHQQVLSHLAHLPSVQAGQLQQFAW
jgi:hypothetical protein